MITQSELKELLHYNPETGVFTWLKPAQGRPLNRVAGTRNKNIYQRIIINQKGYLAHRLAWIYVFGDDLSSYIDHVNGVPSDNRLSNLRLCTQSENNFNTKLKINNTTGFKGVTKNGNSFLASARRDGNWHNLGTYKTPEEASIAYQNFAKVAHGVFFRKT